MIRGKQVLALIPARSGSKGLPGKNLRLIGGHPLVAWTIQAAMNSKFVDQVIVSSDSHEVLAQALQVGAIALERPRELATDSSLASEVIRHALESRRDCDIFAYLQPTSPLRTSVHIDEALTVLTETHAQGVVSVYQSRTPPELMYRVNADGRLTSVISRREFRRQEIPQTYVANGAIYAARVSALTRADYHFNSISAVPYIMSESDSVDIDDLDDFVIAERVLSQQPLNPNGVSDTFPTTT